MESYNYKSWFQVDISKKEAGIWESILVKMLEKIPEANFKNIDTFYKL